MVTCKSCMRFLFNSVRTLEFNVESWKLYMIQVMCYMSRSKTKKKKKIPPEMDKILWFFFASIWTKKNQSSCVFDTWFLMVIDIIIIIDTLWLSMIQWKKRKRFNISRQQLNKWLIVIKIITIIIIHNKYRSPPSQ